jgi:DNA-binding transcriptional LysR family regulator
MDCILPENHPFSAKFCIDLKDFSRMNLISLAEKSKNRFYQAVLKPRGIEPKRVMTVGQPDAIIEMVASGFGAVFSPDGRSRIRWRQQVSAHAPSPETGCRLPGMPPFYETPIFLFFRMNLSTWSVN